MPEGWHPQQRACQVQHTVQRLRWLCAPPRSAHIVPQESFAQSAINRIASPLAITGDNLRKAIGSTALLLAMIASTQPAFGANPGGVSAGCTTIYGQAEIALSSQPEWNDANLVAAASQGYHNWLQQVEHWLGGQSALRRAFPQFTMTWHTFPGGANDKAGQCANGEVRFNIGKLAQFQANNAYLQAISTHEWGHAFGMGHTGEHDSWNSDNPPSMATCRDFTAGAQSSLSQDDEAAVQWVTNVVGGFSAFTANPSFEEPGGIDYWGAASMSDFWVLTSGGGVDGSATYAVLRGATSNSYIYQTNRFVTNGTVGSTAYNVKARVNVRRYVFNDQG